MLADYKGDLQQSTPASRRMVNRKGFERFVSVMRHKGRNASAKEVFDHSQLDRFINEISKTGIYDSCVLEKPSTAITMIFIDAFTAEEPDERVANWLVELIFDHGYLYEMDEESMNEITSIPLESYSPVGILHLERLVSCWVESKRHINNGLNSQMIMTLFLSSGDPTRKLLFAWHILTNTEYFMYEIDEWKDVVVFVWYMLSTRLELGFDDFRRLITAVSKLVDMIFNQFPVSDQELSTDMMHIDQELALNIAHLVVELPCSDSRDLAIQMIMSDFLNNQDISHLFDEYANVMFSALESGVVDPALFELMTYVSDVQELIIEEGFIQKEIVYIFAESLAQYLSDESEFTLKKSLYGMISSMATIDTQLNSILSEYINNYVLDI